MNFLQLYAWDDSTNEITTYADLKEFRETLRWVSIYEWANGVTEWAPLDFMSTGLTCWAFTRRQAWRRFLAVPLFMEKNTDG